VVVKRKEWVGMRLDYVGNAAELLQGGGGKLSPTTGDTGEARKPMGQG
jgi:hypothetical protein